jgi:hypothetical protein
LYFEKATADRRGQREGGAGMTVTDSYDEMREHPREANERFAADRRDTTMTIRFEPIEVT